MEESEQLRSIASWRAKQKLGRAVKLGDVLSELMESRISPQRARFASVAELWSRLLPAELCRHCKITDISGGQLEVLVDSPPYAYELQLCSSKLLKELQGQCPQAKIKKIKVAVG